MNQFLPDLSGFLSPERLAGLVQALLLVVAGLLVSRLVSGALGRTLRGRLDSHRLMLLRRGVYYLLLGLFLVSAMLELGFNLSVLLGTAGLVTVAVGFASQTSMSNLISGLFLLVESPFQVGDTVQLEGTTGVVVSIDLLSVKLRKFDNTFVRVPNEQLLKSQVLTLTKYPIRRLDVALRVDYREDVNQVRQALMTAAGRIPEALEEPAPVFIVQGFGESGLDLQFSVWVFSQNYLNVKNSLQTQIKQAFDAADILFAYPQRNLAVAALTAPFPVQLVATAEPLDEATVGPETAAEPPETG